MLLITVIKTNIYIAFLIRKTCIQRKTVRTSLSKKLSTLVEILKTYKYISNRMSIFCYSLNTKFYIIKCC